MMTPEGRIVAKFVAEVKDRGWEQRKVSYEGRAGAPDRLLLAPGFHCFIEFKAPGKLARLQQEKEHDRLRKAGFKVFVIDTEDAVRSILNYVASTIEHSRLRVNDVHERNRVVKVTRRYGGEEIF